VFPTFPAFPSTTALGALARHLTESDAKHFQPANIHYGLFAALEPLPRKDERRGVYAHRALNALTEWKAQCGL
jgi:methylenetetrahydrofolate--tRNA-(uracil-5-)-methyltransferase